MSIATHEETLADQAALIALLRTLPKGITWTNVADALLEHGSAEAVRAELPGLDLFAESEYEAAADQAHANLAAWQSDGIEFWSILDARYPARVRDIHDAPPFLFAKGRREGADVGFSVVGSREASPRGIRTAIGISAHLASQGLTVIAGLAAGIDTAAHRTALEQNRRTVAVIGTGIDRYYPAANRDLQQQIEAKGLVLSQFWPGAPPTKHSFPMRNSVMSGYGYATIVVEAGEHSGARIQANRAVRHGRPVILTNLVVDRTEWGKALQHEPDVYVVTSINDVANVVNNLRERPSRVDEALSSISI